MNPVVALLIGLGVLIAGFIVLAVLIHYKKDHEPASSNADVALKEPYSFKHFSDIVLPEYQDEIYKLLYIVDGANNSETWQTNEFYNTETLIQISNTNSHRLRVSKITTGTYSDTGKAFASTGESIWVCYVSSAPSDPKQVDDLPKSIEDFDNTNDNNGQLHTLIWVQTDADINGRPVFTEPGARWRMWKTFDTSMPDIANSFMAELDPGDGSTPTLDALFNAAGTLDFVQINRVTPQSKI